MADPDTIAAQVTPIAQDVLMVSLKVSGAGFWGMLKEASHVASYIAHAPQRFPDNPVIPRLVENLKGMIHTSKSAPENNLNLVDVSEMLAKIAVINDILKDEGAVGEGVKQFLYEMAGAVVTAAGSGLFGSGEKVSAAEAKFMDDLLHLLRQNGGELPPAASDDETEIAGDSAPSGE